MNVAANAFKTNSMSFSAVARTSGTARKMITGAEISIHPLNNATVIITARNAQSQKNEWKERAVLNADGGLILGTAAGWIVGRHDDRAGDKGGAGVTWSNGMHWRRVQSAPLQACGTPFPMVKD